MLVERGCAKIPRRFRRRLANLAFVVESEPSAEQLRAAHVSSGGTLLGLYHGRPLTARSVSDGFVMPDQIVIFQGPRRLGAGAIAAFDDASLLDRYRVVERRRFGPDVMTIYDPTTP